MVYNLRPRRKPVVQKDVENTEIAPTEQPKIKPLRVVLERCPEADRLARLQLEAQVLYKTRITNKSITANLHLCIFFSLLEP